LMRPGFVAETGFPALRPLLDKAGELIGFTTFFENFVTIVLLHLLTAFGLQFAIGGMIDLWPEVDGKPPTAAYQAAMAVIAVLQAAGLGWFALAGRLQQKVLQALAPKARPSSRDPYAAALAAYAHRVGSARSHLQFWRRLGLTASALAATMIVTTVSVSSVEVVAHVVTAARQAPVAGQALHDGASPIAPAIHGPEKRDPSMP
jgi:hypothetical protein